MKNLRNFTKYSISLGLVILGLFFMSSISYAAVLGLPERPIVTSDRNAEATPTPTPTHEPVVTTTVETTVLPTHSATPTPTDTTTVDPTDTTTPIPTTTIVPTTVIVTSTIATIIPTATTTVIPGLITTTTPAVTQTTSANNNITPTVKQNATDNLTPQDIYSGLPVEVTVLPKEDMTNQSMVNTFLGSLTNKTSDYTYSPSKISKQDATKYYLVSGSMISIGALMAFSTNIIFLVKKTFFRSNFI